MTPTYHPSPFAVAVVYVTVLTACALLTIATYRWLKGRSK